MQTFCVSFRKETQILSESKSSSVRKHRRSIFYQHLFRAVSSFILFEKKSMKIPACYVNRNESGMN